VIFLRKTFHKFNLIVNAPKLTAKPKETAIHELVNNLSRKYEVLLSSEVIEGVPASLLLGSNNGDDIKEDFSAVANSLSLPYYPDESYTPSVICAEKQRGRLVIIEPNLNIFGVPINYKLTDLFVEPNNPTFYLIAAYDGPKKGNHDIKHTLLYMGQKMTPMDELKVIYYAYVNHGESREIAFFCGETKGKLFIPYSPNGKCKVNIGSESFGLERII
jgi:hypothetical protein